MALGAEVDAMLEDYRAAAAHLAEARAIATELWPAAPAGLVVIGDVRRGRYVDCYEDEVDFEGNRLPTLLAGAGCGAPPRRYIATVGGLTGLLEDVRRDAGDLWETGFDRELLGRIGEAERYEAACAYAIEGSGIAEAKEGARRRAQDLHSLLFEVRKHRPRSVTGILHHGAGGDGVRGGAKGQRKRWRTNWRIGPRPGIGRCGLKLRVTPCYCRRCWPRQCAIRSRRRSRNPRAKVAKMRNSCVQPHGVAADSSWKRDDSGRLQFHGGCVERHLLRRFMPPYPARIADRILLRWLPRRDCVASIEAGGIRFTNLRRVFPCLSQIGTSGLLRRSYGPMRGLHLHNFQDQTVTFNL